MFAILIDKKKYLIEDLIAIVKEQEKLKKDYVELQERHDSLHIAKQDLDIDHFHLKCNIKQLHYVLNKILKNRHSKKKISQALDLLQDRYKFAWEKAEKINNSISDVQL